MRYTILVILALSFFQFISLSFAEDGALPKFVITERYVLSWSEKSKGAFKIDFTEFAQQELHKFTENNLNKEVEIYLGDILVSSPTIRGAFNSGYILLIVNEETKQQARNILSSYKKGKNFQ